MNLKQERLQGDVAIIGMSCLFPKAPDLKSYWQNIVSGVDAIGDPPEYWMAERFFDPASTSNDRVYCKKGGYLGDLARFDPLQFGIMPIAVDGAEPEHFISLRIAHEAMTDAGFPEKPLNRERTEVILGRGTFVNRGYVTLLQHGFVVDQVIDLLASLHPEYTEKELASIKYELKAGLPPFNAETAPGLAHSVMAGLIANRLDLKGSNFVVDAACASCLIALDIAIKDLLTHRCDTVLTGGVQISTPALIHMLFTQLGALSRGSRIRPFDRYADGTVLGEGAGMVVLKRLEDAVRDGHRIYAVVKGVGTASDGKARSVLAPRPEGEELALRRAYENAGLNPSTIGLIEAHGTSIPLGDATEMNTLRRVFGDRHGQTPGCAVGTVKSMIGHLIPAAGIAGIIKTALSLYHRVLPPTLNCAEPNPEMELEKTPFYINTETRPWVHGAVESPRRAGVNAFGFGGINAHAILEEYPEAQDGAESLHHQWDTELCVFSGASRSDLIERCRNVLAFLSSAPDVALKDLAYTVNSRLEDLPCRLSIVVSSVKELERKLEHALKKLNDPSCVRIRDKSGIYFFEDQLGRDGRLAFIFPGEGSQYTNMLSDLCVHFPEVRSCFDTLDRAFEGRDGSYMPSSIIFPPPAFTEAERNARDERMWRMEGAVDAVITADRAIHRLLMELGIKPHAILGHSSGEFMSLEASGAVEYDNEEELVDYIRAGNGVIKKITTSDEIPAIALHAVGGVDRYILSGALEDSGGVIYTAMDNCPNQFVLCGDNGSVDRALEKLRAAGAICQTLPFSRPYHTPLFGPAETALNGFFASLKIVLPKVALYSCMTAGAMPLDAGEIRRLAVGQWTNKVRFSDTIESMYDDGVRIFVEVGPRANLTGFINDTLRGRPFVAVATNVHYRSGITQLNHALGLLCAHGVSMSLEYLYRRRSPVMLDFGSGAAKKVEKKPLPGIAMALPLLKFKDGVARHLASARRVAEGTGKTVPETACPAATVSASMPPDGDAEADGMSTAPPAAVKNRVIDQYMQTMERFLKSQEMIMNKYLARRGNAPSGKGAGVQAPKAANRLPFHGRVTRMTDGEAVTVAYTMGMEREPFLKDHTLGGRVSLTDGSLLALPLVPFSMSVEIMAGAASMLFPMKTLSGLRNIRSHQWIPVEDKEIVLEAAARVVDRGRGEVEVALRIPGQDGAAARAVLDGIMVFSDGYQRPVPSGAFSLRSERPSDISSDEFYPRALFHGPSLQTVKTIRRVGEDGAEAVIEARKGGLFKDTRTPGFLTDPVMLDGMGQVVGLWAADCLESGFVVFPFGIDSLEFYSPHSAGPFDCQARVALEGDSCLKSDILLTGAEGGQRMRVTGLRHKRIYMPELFHLFRGSRDVMLSTPWRSMTETVPDGSVECRRLDAIPFDFWLSDNGIWRTVLAYIILSSAERAAWRDMRGSERRRTEWLLGRAAGKEAVRALLKRRFGVDLWPADIEISADEYKKPVVGIKSGAFAGPAPLLSLSHKNGFVTAMAADGNLYAGVGIDIEHVRSLSEGFLEAAFGPDEQAVLSRISGQGASGWTLRGWCAKEAVGKALGQGLAGDPKNMVLRDLRPASGEAEVGLSGRMADEFSHMSGRHMNAYTRQEGDLIVAVALRKGD